MGKKAKVVDAVALDVLRELQTLRDGKDITEFNKQRIVANTLRNELLCKTYKQVNRLRERGEDAIKDFNKKLKDKGGDFTKATSLELKCVRYVFDIVKEDRRGNAYARVLTIAAEDKITENKFVAWVDERGIDNIRRNTDASEQLGEAQKNLGEKTLRTARAKSLDNAEFVKDSDTPFTLALVRKNSDGSKSIVKWVTNSNLINSAIKAVGADTLKQQQEDIIKKAANSNQKAAVEGARATSEVPAEKSVVNG